MEAEFEACEQVKASMAKHKKAVPGSAGETEFSGYNFILWLGKGGSHIVWGLYVFMLYIHGLQTSLFGAEAT